MRGKEVDGFGFFLRSWDHPRVCGEKRVLGLKVCDILGSPPRMRGKGLCSGKLGLAQRITPAYAGKSCPGVYGYGFTGDHPRVCGEKLIVILYKSL